MDKLSLQTECHVLISEVQWKIIFNYRHIYIIQIQIKSLATTDSILSCKRCQGMFWTNSHCKLNAMSQFLKRSEKSDTNTGTNKVDKRNAVDKFSLKIEWCIRIPEMQLKMRTEPMNLVRQILQRQENAISNEN